jgi:guanyl-specific ribonuclease Sa
MNTRILLLAVLMAMTIFSQANVYADAATGAAALTPAQIEAARTPADHEAIAQALEAEAATLDEKAKSHEAMERIYRGGGIPKANWVTMANHCKSLIAQYRSTAKETRELAAAHRAAAKALK